MTCISVTNSHISNVEFGASVSANNMLFSGNEIEHFGDDGIDYNASNIMITKNYVHDGVDLADGAHPDGLQGYPGKYSNVVIDSNRVIRQTDPNLPFPNFLQGDRRLRRRLDESHGDEQRCRDKRLLGHRLCERARRQDHQQHGSRRLVACSQSDVCKPTVMPSATRPMTARRPTT